VHDKEHLMTTATYDVKGMTCGHCVAYVSNALGNLPGVDAVDVDLDAGTATVTSDGPVDTDAVREAVTEAGYELGS
jgi:copper ion binding protein